MLKAESLKPQDILTACKLYAYEARGGELTYSGLGRDVGLSPSEAHASVERCRRAALFTPSNVVVRRNLRELLVAGVPLVYYPTRGGIACGMLTSIHAPSLVGRIAPSAPALVPVVWPGSGRDRGESLSPVYKAVPQACAADDVLYEVMALVDVVRVGTPSERSAAVDIIDKLLSARRGSREDKTT